MKNSAYIRLKSDPLEIYFEWRDFDGDDCFNDFHIVVTFPTGTLRFDFGPCVVRGLKKVSRFLRGKTQTSINGGFQHPDIRVYEVHREHHGYRLFVRFEGNGLNERFYIENPSMEIDDELLKLFVPIRQ